MSAAVEFVASSPAAALSAAPAPALVGFPTPDSVDVPTDVIPIYDRLWATPSDPDAPLGGVFELNTESGGPIALIPRQSHIWHVELVPTDSLQPLTKYTLSGSWISRQSGGNPVAIKLALTFTTGAGPVRGDPQVPKAFMQHYSLATPRRTSRDPEPHGSCIAHPTESFVEHLYLDGVNDPSIYDGASGVHVRYLYGQSVTTNLSGIDQGTPFKCVRLRTRAHNGKYSQHVDLCAKDAPRFEFPDGVGLTCGPEGLTYQGRLATAIRVTDAGAPDAGVDATDVANGAEVAAGDKPTADARASVAQGTAGCSFAKRRPDGGSPLWYSLVAGLALVRAYGIRRPGFSG